MHDVHMGSIKFFTWEDHQSPILNRCRVQVLGLPTSPLLELCECRKQYPRTLTCHFSLHQNQKHLFLAHADSMEHNCGRIYDFKYKDFK